MVCDVSFYTPVKAAVSVTVLVVVRALIVVVGTASCSDGGECSNGDALMVML